jgi:hypothetical protein
MLIVVICIIGFLLSFRNRSFYGSNNTDYDSLMTNYNTSFELSLFTIFVNAVGQVQTGGMGIDRITSNNAVNYFIFGLFIFLIPVLFMNIFTGISIDEIQKLIQHSEAENKSIKIRYSFKIESIIRFLFKKENSKRFENLLKKRESQIEKTVTFVFKIKFLRKSYEVFLNNNKIGMESGEDRAKSQLDELEKKLSHVLLELNQVSLMCQNKFEYLEKKIDSIGKKESKEKG